jgi:ankyrin repeat protein
LHAAVAKAKSKEIVQLLLDYKADPNIQSGAYGTALHAAIAVDASTEIVQLLLCGGDNNLTVNDKLNILWRGPEFYKSCDGNINDALIRLGYYTRYRVSIRYRCRIDIVS